MCTAKPQNSCVNYNAPLPLRHHPPLRLSGVLVLMWRYAGGGGSHPSFSPPPPLHQLSDNSAGDRNKQTPYTLYTVQ